MTRVKRGFPSWLVNAVLSAFALALLALAVWSNRVQINEVFSRDVSESLFILAFAIYMAALLLTFARWFLLVRALGLPFRMRDATRLGFIGNVFNLVIPGAVGGDVIKGAFLCREQDRKTQAVASMVIDRAVGLLGLFLLAGGTGAARWGGAAWEVRLLIGLALGASACGLTGLAVLFTPGLYRPLLARLLRRGRLAAMLEELVKMASVYRARLGVVGAALGMACVSHSLFVVAFYLVDGALFPEQSPSLAQHFLVAPLALFTTAIPLPFGALGLSENLTGFLFEQVGHDGGAVAMMGFRVLMYAGGLVSVAVYLANLKQVRKLSSEAQGLDADDGHREPASAESSL